ncbi:hypothetical protein EXIGLDRAFT_720446 [Exidia glandulosa HHB12029]|uniref:NAD(P)-binding protein n=1 Tax=Exidia glandulosa HHB12029 TaxID=1314781 RepID=A0A165NJJ5_EXIGL|nr:hypothetical protein EXIGLDRAFT_720446 [Exidia glandulosa HHB12029]
MPSLSTARASNAKFSPKSRPVIVVFGGTNGIGAGIIRAFARHTPSSVGAHIVIIGRSKASADVLIASLPAHTTSRYDFLSLNALLIHDLRTFIREQLFGTLGLTKINYLILSQGEVVMKSSARTSEGIHPMLSLALYGRARAALDLAPLVEAAAALGEEARIMTVVKAGAGGPLDLEDLAFSKGSMIGNRGRIVTYTDIYTAAIAARHPTISVIHVDPGMVRSGLKRGFPFFLRWIMSFVEWLFGTSAEDCGEWMMYALLDPSSKTGAWAKSPHADTIEPNRWAVDETARRVVWQHVEERSDL